MNTMLRLVGALWAAALAASAVELGDTPAAVRAELGPPGGVLQSGARLLFTYPLGEVEFRSNAVVRCELISPEEAEARRLAQAEDWARQQQWAAAQREARIAAGKSALAALRADLAFPSRPAAEQVALWRSFQQQYPEVPVDAECAEALRRLELVALEQRVARAEQRRIDLLEARVEEAEARARAAERRSLQRTFRFDDSYGYAYPVCYPVVAARPACRPRAHEREAVTNDRPTLSITLRNSASLVRGNVALVRN